MGEGRGGNALDSDRPIPRFSRLEEVLGRKEFRSSIVRLAEDTADEVRAVLHEQGSDRVIREETTAFRTLSSRVPVARTLRVSELLRSAGPDGGLVLDLKSTSEGWIEIVGDVPIIVPEAPPGAIKSASSPDQPRSSSTASPSPPNPFPKHGIIRIGDERP